jgi:hypothetical protein
MKLKRKKVGDRSYQLVDTKTGKVIATAAQTGEHGRDNYPWEWSLSDEMIFGRLDIRTGHSVESLRDAVDIIETGINHYGLYKPVGKVSGYDIKEGQVFKAMHRGLNYYYRATQDAYGEFNAYIPANNSKGELTEVLVPHGLEVVLFVKEA